MYNHLFEGAIFRVYFILLGGFPTRENKYIAVKVNGKKYDEHRAVWQKHYGPIPDGHVIHHKNGLKWDNRIENLELMTRAAHTRHHIKDRQSLSRENSNWYAKVVENQKKLRIVGPRGTSWCGRCKKFLSVSNFTRDKNHWNGLAYMCRACRSSCRSKSRE